MPPMTSQKKRFVLINVEITVANGEIPTQEHEWCNFGTQLLCPSVMENHIFWAVPAIGTNTENVTPC